MKIYLKYGLVFSLFAIQIVYLGSCSSGAENSKAMALIESSGCQTCHKYEGALIGPAYADVAKRYAGGGEEVVNALANSVIAGGSGNWGEVPMTPHPHISEEDAETMIRYILSL